MPRPVHRHRITSPTFVPARTVVLAVKPACALALRHPIANRAGADLWAPPLLFGEAKPPQLNYPPGTVPEQDDCSRLDIQCEQAVFHLTAPRDLATAPLGLPPMLHNPHRDANTKV